jgi:uncharacterized membrane protein
MPSSSTTERPRTGWTDARIARAIGVVLRVGLGLAATLVLAGGVLDLVRRGSSAPAYQAFHGEPTELRTVVGIVHAALALRGRGLIQLGLLLLIATPIARVAFAAIAFALERDRLYMAIALVVLAILLVSLRTGVG